MIRRVVGLSMMLIFLVLPGGAEAHAHYRSKDKHAKHQHAHKTSAESSPRPLRIEPDGTEILSEEAITSQDEREMAETKACCEINLTTAEELEIATDETIPPTEAEMEEWAQPTEVEVSPSEES